MLIYEVRNIHQLQIYKHQSYDHSLQELDNDLLLHIKNYLEQIGNYFAIHFLVHLILVRSNIDHLRTQGAERLNNRPLGLVLVLQVCVVY